MPLNLTNVQAVLLISLLPLGVAAWQDIRTRHVSNWITIPLFVLAWPLAWWLHGWEGLAVTGVVFLVTLFAMPYGFGAADGKLAVFLAAVGGALAVLLALLMSLVILIVTRTFPFLATRLPFVFKKEDGCHITGVPLFLVTEVLILCLCILGLL
jgi:Flp pilus assembly protein protease CpaA